MPAIQLLVVCWLCFVSFGRQMHRLISAFRVTWCSPCAHVSVSKFPLVIRKDSSRIGLGPTNDLILTQLFFICNDFISK